MHLYRELQVQQIFGSSGPLKGVDRSGHIVKGLCAGVLEDECLDV